MSDALILEVAHGPHRHTKAVLRPGQRLVVGRGPDADWTLTDDALAARQLELAWDGRAGRLRHLGGDVATCLEGQPVEAGPVGHGSWIRAGLTDLTAARERHTPPDEPPAPVVFTAAASALARLRAVQTPLYAIADASRHERVRVLLRESPAAVRSLYDGVQADTLAEAAPYLVALAPTSELLADLVHEGWRRRWCTFLTAPPALAADDVRRHLRKFLMVQLESTGETAYFRYYDPYVLRAYLAACTPDERRAFVGPLTYMILDDDGALHVATA